LISKAKEYRTSAEDSDRQAAAAKDADVKAEFQERARRSRALEI
jgi:hypothetical protein